ncbi:hypothetical protein V2590_07490 [Tenacibaculum maritimum]|uniref:hypothetical protein n=1 Tax=Tenacibaculum maritimum TaxID=107401 RepID=UPI0038778C22
MKKYRKIELLNAKKQKKTHTITLAIGIALLITYYTLVIGFEINFFLIQLIGIIGGLIITGITWSKINELN